MPRSDLISEIASGVQFWGWDEAESLLGVMGLQKVRDATLIRHAYVGPQAQGRGIGGALLGRLASETSGPLLIGTWAAAEWAIRFYVRHGFHLVPAAEKRSLLETYWNIPERQQESSVVLQRSEPPDQAGERTRTGAA